VLQIGIDMHELNAELLGPPPALGPSIRIDTTGPFGNRSEKKGSTSPDMPTLHETRQQTLSLPTLFSPPTAPPSQLYLPSPLPPYFLHALCPAPSAPENCPVPTFAPRPPPAQNVCGRSPFPPPTLFRSCLASCSPRSCRKSGLPSRGYSVVMLPPIPSLPSLSDSFYRGCVTIRLPKR